MCKLCEPILGRDTLCKSEKECPLRQAAYCGQCACRGHFQGDCDYKPRAPKSEIPCVSPEVREPVLYLRDDPKSTVAFLKRFKIDNRTKEGVNEDEQRKIEEKQKKVLKRYLEEQHVTVEFIPTAWTKKKIYRKVE